MLNGVGGKTIEEAKERISYDEFCNWIKYRNKRGSLNTANRLEEMIAILISMMTALQAKEMQAPNKFMPYLSPDNFIFKSQAETIDNPPIEAIFGLLKGLSKK